MERKPSWTIHIGSWTLTTWLKAIALMAAVFAAGSYISQAPLPPAEFASAPATPAAAVSSPVSRHLRSGRVVGITDGDTIRVLLDGREERVRLEGIDCPESHQPYGTRAKHFTADLAFGQTVSLKVSGRDRYSRMIAEVILRDGRSLNRELVKAGLAWWYREYSSNADLAQLEQEARQAGRGLWGEADPIPPWQFRRKGAAPH